MTWKTSRQLGTATAIQESSGPTVLAVGAVADGQVLSRSGATIIGGIIETGGPTALTMAAIADGQLVYRTGSTVAGTGQQGISSPSATGSASVYSGSAWVDSVRGTDQKNANSDGFALVNTTASDVSNTVQYSPCVVIGGTGWDTDGAVSQKEEWGIYVKPVSGTAVYSYLTFLRRVNGGAWTEQVTMQASATGSNLTAGNAIVVGTTAQFYLYGTAAWYGGIGAAAMLASYNTNIPFLFVKTGRTDAASANVFITAYDAAAASVTNAATMRTNSFGWINNAGAYTETAAVYVDGSIEGTQVRAAVGATATGRVSVHSGPSATEGLQRVVITETLSPSAIETSMTTAVPAGAIIRAVFANCQSALTGGGTTVTWSLGITGTVNKYGTAGDGAGDTLAKNSKSHWMPTDGEDIVLAAAETIKLCAADADGDAAGNTALTNGSVKVVVIYDAIASLADAA